MQNLYLMKPFRAHTDLKLNIKFLHLLEHVGSYDNLRCVEQVHLINLEVSIHLCIESYKLSTATHQCTMGIFAAEKRINKKAET